MKALSLLRKKKSKGFTLVELVIVIAVLAIIAAIAIPTVNGVIKNANTATDASNAQAITMTLKTFEAEIEAKDSIDIDTAKKTAATNDTTTKLSTLFALYGTTFPTPKTSGFKIFWNTSTKSAYIAASATTGSSDAEITGDTFISTLGLNV